MKKVGLCKAGVGDCICRRSKPRPEHGSNTQAWGFGLVTTHMLNSFVFNYGYSKEKKTKQQRNEQKRTAGKPKIILE